MRVHRPLALNGGQQHFATVHEGSPNPTLYGTSLGLPNVVNQLQQGITANPFGSVTPVCDPDVDEILFAGLTS
ncbi:hypothetical protein Pla22_24400 [Rubripirellula amarantea]|uniref:Uncharacterized protein n=1 Tax=Rubripirellula amarantea TaxID=2527999 RepID=A0A5C5WVS4_9BACT|nr:hypothetical protein Pla22_24400 [Rubripirellula amarantea]